MNQNLKEYLIGGRSQHRRGLSLNGISEDTDENLDLFSRNRRSLSVASSDESDGFSLLLKSHFFLHRMEMNLKSKPAPDAPRRSSTVRPDSTAKTSRVSTSMKDLRHDVFGISKENKDPRAVKGNKELLDALPEKITFEDGGYLSDDAKEVDSEQFEKILKCIRSGIDSGATLETGGERFGTKGYHIAPSVFSIVQGS
ncbi:uncharacterized protein LOC132282353 [Cornus florida]|uniref:uncharacterized protein LOC132282353 n=1 Tax=Cornus florida TaxID=4283 RepID=UPI0028A26806|nr:uncharacterized protein LOC132282353 [Cornus florida]